MGKRSQALDSAEQSAASLVRAELERARTPLTGAQLAERTGLTTQSVRHHLRAMHQAGTAYVTPAAETPRGRRGRPARTWALRHEAESRALAQVARVLATLLDGAPPADLDDQLARIGASLSRQPGPGGDRLMSGLARLGFSPRAVGSVDGRDCIELDSCPFFDPAEGVTDTRICRVHERLAAGMTGQGQRIEQLEIDPRGVGCRLHVAQSDAT
ncbi:MAG: HTH domain-containing protein [Thermoleophilia bacterium]|nr:HTH domain-containing protein [Thermoleophilia bacterium]